MLAQTGRATMDYAAWLETTEGKLETARELRANAEHMASRPDIYSRAERFAAERAAERGTLEVAS
jgi:hypothetical protein